MIYLYFLFLGIIIVSASIQLSKQAEIIEKNSNINTLILGSLIALSTSLPELATSITSVLLNQSEMSISNILGSNIFNLVILALFNIIFLKKLVYNKTSKKLNITNYLIIGIYFSFFVSVALANTNFFHIGRIDITSLVIVGMYFISLKLISENEEDINDQKLLVSENSRNKEKLKKSYLLFIIYAIIILITSINLAKVAEEIMTISGLNASFVGAIFIGITTSLPELVTSFSLIKNNYYDMAASGIISSNIFNFLILAIVDLLDKGSLQGNAQSEAIILLIMGILFTIITILAISRKSVSKISNALPALSIIIIYLLFVLNGG